MIIRCGCIENGQPRGPIIPGITKDTHHERSCQWISRTRTNSSRSKPTWINWFRSCTIFRAEQHPLRATGDSSRAQPHKQQLWWRLAGRFCTTPSSRRAAATFSRLPLWLFDATSRIASWVALLPGCGSDDCLFGLPHQRSEARRQVLQASPQSARCSSRRVSLDW